MPELLLDCPICGIGVVNVAYSVNFVFVDGYRHRTNATWDIAHDSGECHQLYDGEHTIGTEVPAGVAWEWDPELRLGQLRDLYTGEVVLRWREPAQQERIQQ